MPTDLLTISLDGPRAAGGARRRDGEFLAGPENALAVAAAGRLSAGVLPPSPLVLYGPAGAGKTLLARGLADCWQAAHPQDRVLVTTGSDFARELAQAVATDAADDFARTLRRCRLLAIDGVDDLAGKPAAQQLLLRTLDALSRRGAVVILTMHACPTETAGLPAQLASRLLAGLVVPLAAPTAQTRRNILQHLAAQLDASLDEALLARLAADWRLSLARLKLIIGQLARKQGQESSPATIDDHALKSLLADDEPTPQPPSVAQITAALARQLHVPHSVFKGNSRRATAVLARGLAMLAARRFRRMSYEQIGRHFGRRDHTTVLHACRKLERVLQSDPLVEAAWRRLLAELNLEEAAAPLGNPRTASDGSNE